MKERVIKCLVDKLWNCEVFQEEIAQRIKNTAESWLFNRFGKYLTEFKGYNIIHDVDETIPLIYRNFDEVKEAVKVVEEIQSTEPGEVKAEKKSKRKYNRKKKEVKE